MGWVRRSLVVTGLAACGTAAPVTPPPAPQQPAPAAPSSACAGASIDLARAFANPACKLAPEVAATTFQAAKRTLAFAVEPRALRATPGGPVTLEVTLTNTGAAPVDLFRFAGFHALAREVTPTAGGDLQLQWGTEIPEWWGHVQLAAGGQAHLHLALLATATVQEHTQLGSGSNAQLVWVNRTGALAPGSYAMSFAIDLNSDEDAFDARVNGEPVLLTVSSLADP